MIHSGVQSQAAKQRNRVSTLNAYRLITLIIPIIMTPALSRAACVCEGSNKDWQTIAELRDSVFAAKVIKKTGQEIIFQREEVYKGNVDKTVILPAPEMECMLPIKHFEVGASYLIATSNFEKLKPEGSTFHLGVRADPPLKAKSPKLVKWLKSKKFKE